MPSLIKTPNLGLNQWAGNEYVKRTDFVEDNKKIDDAFGELEETIKNIDLSSTKVIRPNKKNVEESLINIENELDESENTKYATVNGSKEFECKSGYVDNIKIEGNTIKNEIIFNNFNTQFYNFDSMNGTVSVKTLDNRDWSLVDLVAILEPNTQYFVDMNLINDITSDFKLFSSPTTTDAIDIDTSSKMFLTDNTHTFLKIKLFGSGSITNFRIVKGSKQIPYFEGLKSVGQGDKIEVLTYPNAQTNLAEGVEYIQGNLSPGSNGFFTNNLNNLSMIIPCLPNSTYIIDKLDLSDRTRVATAQTAPIHATSVSELFFDNVGATMKVVVTTPSNANYLIIHVTNSNQRPRLNIKNKVDKKQILTTIRSLSNVVKDEIVKQGDKYYKIVRCGEITLNGSELGWDGTIPQYNSDTVVGFVLRDFIRTKYLISDKFKYTVQAQVQNPNHEYITCEPGYVGNWFVIGINKTKLETQDLVGFKKWIQANPVTIVYELETPIITEIPNFNPRTFADKTTFLLNSGVVQGEAELEVTNSLGSSLDVMGEKVSCLDNSIQVVNYKAEQAFQSGNKVKKDLVDKLISLGYDVSTESTFEELIAIISKSNFPGWMNAENGYWAKCATFNGYTGIGAASVGSKIYMFGGSRYDSYSQRIYCYDTLTNVISDIGEMPSNIYTWWSRVRDVSCVAYGNLIYCLGGYYNDSTNGSKYFNINAVYNTVTGAWETKAPLPYDWKSIQSMLIDDSIYSLGGYVKSVDSHNMNCCYNVKTNTWTTNPNIPSVRQDLSACNIGYNIYTFGGQTWSNGWYNCATVECYNVKTKTWTTLPDMPQRRSSHTSTAYNGRIFIVGGGGNTDTQVYIYSPKTNTWTTGNNINTGRSGHSSTISESNVYIVGGMYTAGSNVWTTEIESMIIQ